MCIETPVFVLVEVLVLVLEVVQLSHITGQSIRTEIPNTGWAHCDPSKPLQNSGSGNPLQPWVAVEVVVVCVAVVDVSLMVEEVVVAVAVVVVVLTQVLHSAKHMLLIMIPK